MKLNDKVEISGRTVILTAETEAGARELAARADRERVSIEGSKAELVDQIGDAFGEFTDKLGRPQMGILGWVMTLVACRLAYASFERVAPAPEFAVLFGIVGCAVILVMKIGAARWAKGINLNNKKLADFYRNVVFVCMAVVLLIGVAFQAAVSDDRDSGVVAAETSIEEEQRQINRAALEADGLPRGQISAEELAGDLTRSWARPALNNKNEPTGFTVGEAIGVGGAKPGEQSAETYCVPAKDRNFYIDRYCPDDIDRAKDLQRRLAYDAAVADVAARQAALEARKKAAPPKASSIALGEKLWSGPNTVWVWIFAAVVMLAIESFMVFCVFVSKLHPKGVSAMLDELGLPAPPAAQTSPAAAGGV